MKKSILSILFALYLFIAQAQDVITLKNGDEIRCKIIEVGIENLKYKKWEYKDGPDFILSKKDIFMIKYQDGSKEVIQPILDKIETGNKDTYIDENGIEVPKPKVYGRNIFSWNPYNLAIGGNLSFAYEITGKSGYVGFRLPLMIPVISNYYNNYLTGLEIKVYPTGPGAVRGYIGNSLLLVGGADYQFYGVAMFNGGISFQPAKMFNITVGSAFGLGASGSRSYYRGSLRYDSYPFYKIDITLGIRF